jgi:hypothetical protein
MHVYGSKHAACGKTAQENQQNSSSITSAMQECTPESSWSSSQGVQHAAGVLHMTPREGGMDSPSSMQEQNPRLLPIPLQAKPASHAPPSFKPNNATPLSSGNTRLSRFAREARGKGTNQGATDNMGPAANVRKRHSCLDILCVTRRGSPLCPVTHHQASTPQRPSPSNKPGGTPVCHHVPRHLTGHTITQDTGPPGQKPPKNPGRSPRY